jgi:prepilin-type N-terminal cleavage/methylation domain-containing protein
MGQRRRPASVAAHAVRGDAGFSLAELLVAIAILGMMMAAIFVTLEVSQKTWTRATSVEEAQLGARAVLERMATEMRLIGSHYAGAAGGGTAITAATATSITFRGDMDADTVTSAGDEATTTAATSATPPHVTVSAATGFCPNEILSIARGATREVGTISSISGTGLTLAASLATTFASGSTVRSVETVSYTYNPADGTLTRSQTASRDSAGVCTSPSDAVLSNVVGLTLEYFQSDGTTTAATPALIREIRINLTTRGTDGSRRTMTARVRPRSLGL